MRRLRWNAAELAQDPMSTVVLASNRTRSKRACHLHKAVKKANQLKRDTLNRGSNYFWLLLIQYMGKCVESWWAETEVNASSKLDDNGAKCDADIITPCRTEMEQWENCIMTLSFAKGPKNWWQSIEKVLDFTRRVKLTVLPEDQHQISWRSSQ